MRFDGSALTATYGIVVHRRSNVIIKDCSFRNFKYCAIVMRGGDFQVEPTTYATGNRVYRDTLINCSGYYVGNGYGSMEILGQDGLQIYDSYMTVISRASGVNGYLIKGVGGYNKGLLIHDNYFEKLVDNMPYQITLEFWNSMGGIQIYDNEIKGGYIDVGGVFSVKGAYDYSFDIYGNDINLTTINTTDYPVNGITIEGGASDVIVRNNLIENLTYPIVISVMQTSTTLRRVYIYYNIIKNWGNSANTNGTAIYFNTDETTATIRDVHFYNNIIYDDGTGTDPRYCVWIQPTDDGIYRNLVFKNNIFQGASLFFFRTQWTTGAPTIDTLKFMNNDVYGNAYSNDPYYDANLTPTHITYTGNLKVDPEFTAPDTDFTLQATSDCIDAG
jgi:hypothetical protein